MKLRYRITWGIFAVLGIAIAVFAFVLSRTDDCGARAPLADDVDRMKAVVYRCYGGPEVLEYVDVEKPVPGDDEVLVKVHTAAVNPYDWHFMRGSPYIMRLGSGLNAPEDPRMGVDFAGTVEAVGKNVERFEPGDRVFGGASGAFAEYLSIREGRAVAHIPIGVTFDQAASVGIAALTALQALRDAGQLRPGQSVLINGASGGVGTFAVQIAKSMGADVSGVCSTRNVDMVQSIGADRVFDYKKENYTESGQTFDLIVDMVGNHSISANRKVLNPGGRLVLVGGSKGDWIGPLIGPIGAMIQSPFVDEELITLLARLTEEDLAIVAELIDAGDVKPVFDRRFPLSETAAAIRYSEEGRARGKILINVNAE